MRSVVIVDSGCANVGSVRYALERLDARVSVSADRDEIETAERVVLPGVGSAAAAMGALQRRGLIETLRGLSQPVLGICLGMQILFERSEEGNVECLGVLPGVCRRLGPGVRIPHMGWSRLMRLREDPLIRGIAEGDYAYFVHSFAVDADADCVLAAHHGRSFAAMTRQRNYWGAQFHPERSGKAGARILQNFLEMT